MEELNLALQEKKTKMALQQLEDEEVQRAEEKEAAQQAQQEAATRMRLEAEAERARRQHERQQAQAEARAEQARREWEDDWIRRALQALPKDLPSELTFEVTQAVRQTLREMYPSADHAEDLVGAAVQHIIEKALRPWRRHKDAAKAAEEALKQLPILARAYFGALSEWEVRAKAQAIAEIAKLPEPATSEQMTSAARAAGKRVAEECNHSESCKWAMMGVARLLPGLLESSSSQERVKAEEAVRVAFAGLPIGASTAQFDAARDAALAPFIRGEAEAKATREAKEAEGKLEREADVHLYRVDSYLAELEVDPDGWDFEGKRYEYTKQIKREIRADLIEDLPLDPAAGRARVQELADEWLANHWQAHNEPEKKPDLNS